LPAGRGGKRGSVPRSAGGSVGSPRVPRLPRLWNAVPLHGEGCPASAPSTGVILGGPGALPRGPSDPLRAAEEAGSSARLAAAPGVPAVRPRPSQLSCSPRIAGRARGVSPPTLCPPPRGCSSPGPASLLHGSRRPWLRLLPPSAPRSHRRLSSAPNFEHRRRPAPSPSPSLDLILHIFATQHLK